MLALLILGNPVPNFQVNEFMVAPDSLEFLEILIAAMDDVRGFKLVVDQDTIAFKIDTLGYQRFYLMDTTVLERKPTLNDTGATIRIIDSTGAMWMEFTYGDTMSGCENDVRTPPRGFSSAYAGGFEYHYYWDASPTPGEYNDDRDTNSVFGKVLDASTGQAISGAVVTLTATRCYCSALYPGQSQAVSGPDGSFELPFGPCGYNVLVITASHDDYAQAVLDTIVVDHNYVHLKHDILMHSVGAKEASGTGSPVLAAVPNPAFHVLNLRWARNDEPVLLYDVTGRLLRALPGQQGEAHVRLEAGVYLVRHGEQLLRAVLLPTD